MPKDISLYLQCSSHQLSNFYLGNNEWIMFFWYWWNLTQGRYFLEFIKCSIKERLLNSVIFLPIIFISFLIYLVNTKGKFGLNLILFFLFLGISESQLGTLTEKFCKSFSLKMTPFDNALKQLEFHKANGDQVIFISGTPVEFIKQIYPSFFNTTNFEVIGSITRRNFGSFYLDERCIYKNKRRC